MMKIFLAQIGLYSHASSAWGFTALILLILFVVLVATEGSKNKDK